jgi:hypothetical protein
MFRGKDSCEVKFGTCTSIPHHYRSPEVEPGRAESQYRYNNKDMYWHPLSLQEPRVRTGKGGVTVHVQ